jgi:hypothetical protein
VKLKLLNHIFPCIENNLLQNLPYSNMKQRSVITAISLALFMAPAATAAELQMNQDSLSDYKEVANQNSDQLPGFVKDLVGNQDINIYIDQNMSESYNLSLQMNGTNVETIDNQSLEQPDVEVWTSTEIINNISESEKPIEQMKTAINEDKVKYQANDTWTKIKLFFAEKVINLF